MGLGRSSSLSAIVTPHLPRNRAKTVTVAEPTLPGQATHVVGIPSAPKVSPVQVMDRGVGWCEGQSCSTRPDCDPSGGAALQPRSALREEHHGFNPGDTHRYSTR